MSKLRSPRSSRDRGAATLVVVLVLFFVMALVAAYANRNLIVEQRIAANYQDVALAAEMAAKALDNSLAWLNGGRLDTSCRADAAGPSTFRDRYLDINDAGEIANKAFSGINQMVVACDRSAALAWTCQCPENGVPTRRAAEAERSASALLSLSRTAGSGNILVSAVGCAQASGGCSPVIDDSVDGFQAFTVLRATLALSPALRSPPSSALVVRGSANLGAGMVAVNGDASSGGVAVQVGGALSGSTARLQGPAGAAPGLALLAPAGGLAALSSAQFFQSHFGMPIELYREQPALRLLRDCASDCDTQLTHAAAAGAQLLWVEGDLDLPDDFELGSVGRPVVLVVNGRLRIGSALRLHGLIYVNGNGEWNYAGAGPAWVNGAVLVAGDWSAESGAQLRYDPLVLQRLKTQAGSYVRVPGGVWSEQ